MPRSFHVSQSILGPLMNWSYDDWHRLKGCFDGVEFKDVREIKLEFLRLYREGYDVLPSTGCDNFDKTKGCLGHEVKEEDAAEATSLQS